MGESGRQTLRCSFASREASNNRKNGGTRKEERVPYPLGWKTCTREIMESGSSGARTRILLEVRKVSSGAVGCPIARIFHGIRRVTLTESRIFPLSDDPRMFDVVAASLLSDAGS